MDQAPISPVLPLQQLHRVQLYQVLTRRDVATARKKVTLFIHSMNAIVYYRFVLHAGLKRRHDDSVMESIAKFLLLLTNVPLGGKRV